MKTAIIMPTWNNSNYSVQCLESLAKNTNGYHLIWIDNGSDLEERNKVQETIERLGIFYRSLSNPKNLGFPKAINQGLKIAMAKEYDPIVLLNNDVILTERWLEKLIKSFEKHPKLGVVGSLHEGGTQYYKKFHRNNLTIDQINQLSLGVRMVSTTIPFSCVAIRREVIKKIGLLDEAFSPCLGEDNDYCDRIRSSGWQLGFCLNCITYHKHRATVSKIPNWGKIQQKNEMLLRRKRQERILRVNL